MASPRLIRRRIRSVQNTRKITKAMELVAAAKMRKAVRLTLSSRAYAHTIKAVVEDVQKHIDPRAHRLVWVPQAQPVSMAIVVASDRGLCAGFNTQVLRKAVEFIRQHGPSELLMVSVGKRAEYTLRKLNLKIAAAFESISNAPGYDRIRPVSEYVTQEFLNGRVNKVFIIYTDYKSALTQIPTIEQLLPVIQSDQKLEAETADMDVTRTESVFEPGPDEVLDTLLPRLLEIRVYQALLEAAASEHSARMMAMRNATENASDMLGDLTFTFNQARQAGITREISEISAGKAAIG